MITCTYNIVLRFEELAKIYERLLSSPQYKQINLIVLIFILCRICLLSGLSRVPFCNQYL